MFLNVSRKDPYEEEPVVSQFDNFGHTRLGVFVADDNRVANLHGQSGSQVADVRTRQSVVVTSLEVDPQVPSHGCNLRPRRYAPHVSSPTGIRVADENRCLQASPKAPSRARRHAR